MQIPLRAILQNHGDEFLESLQASGYQYGARLPTLPSPASRDSGVVNVDNLLGHRETECFLKEKVFLAAVDGCHRSSCILKLAKYGQPGTKRISQPIWLTLIIAPDSEVFTDFRILKLSSSASLL